MHLLSELQKPVSAARAKISQQRPPELHFSSRCLLSKVCKSQENQFELGDAMHSRMLQIAQFYYLQGVFCKGCHVIFLVQGGRLDTNQIFLEFLLAKKYSITTTLSTSTLHNILSIINYFLSFWGDGGMVSETQHFLIYLFQLISTY